MSEKMQCEWRVTESGRVLSRRCLHDATVKSEGGWRCAVHSPEAMRRRLEAAKAKEAERRQAMDSAASLLAARAAVVEAAKAWEMADFGRDQEEADALADAVANLKKLERPDA